MPLLALTDVDPTGGTGRSRSRPATARGSPRSPSTRPAQGKVSLALMTLDTPFGDAALRRLRARAGRRRPHPGRRGSLPGGRRRPDAGGALDRDPPAGAVVVWGLPLDLPIALDALRRRGYLGMVYARPRGDPGRPPGARSPRRGAAFGGRPLDRPAGAARTRRARGPAADRTPEPRGVAAFVGRALAGDPTAATHRDRAVLAQVDDALVWLLAAKEQVAALGLDDGVATRRQALRDALIGRPSLPLAAGTYDASDADRRRRAGRAWWSPSSARPRPERGRAPAGRASRPVWVPWRRVGP